MAKGAQPPPDETSAEMKTAWHRLELGDVRSARQQAQAMLAHSPHADDRAQAEELLRRTRTPPVLYAYAILAAALMGLLLMLSVLRY